MPATLLRNRKVTLVAALLTILVPCTKGSALASEEQFNEQGTCIFMQQLQDEEQKIKFVNQLRLAKEASTSRYGESFANTVQARMKNGQIMDIDIFSMDCLTCHDGVSAKERDIRYKNDSENRTQDILSVVGSHPIGMDYGSYAYGSREFKPLGSLKRGIELIDGKVGCLSCHNPFNKKRYHLATDNKRSELCLSCHQK